MGREIRRVPPGWQHPMQPCPHSPWRNGCETAHQNNGQCYKPLYDRSFAEAARQWLDNAIAWDTGTHPDLVDRPELKDEYPFFWQWDGECPDPDYYRPEWTPEEATAYQVYETVSEGTPTSPVFTTPDDLKAWLIQQGHSETSATAFINGGWAPSAVFYNGQMASGIDALGMMEQMKTTPKSP